MGKSCTYIKYNTVDDNETGTNNQSQRHYCIPIASFVEVIGQCPRSGVSVVRLNSCPAPGRVAITIYQKIAIAIHNGDHDDVVDESSEYSTIDLSQEHGAGRYFDCIDLSAWGR